MNTDDIKNLLADASHWLKSDSRGTYPMMPSEVATMVEALRYVLENDAARLDREARGLHD